MLDYAVPLMILAVFISIRLLHRCIVAIAFLVISIICTSSISPDMTIYSFILYSLFELIFIAACYAVNTNDTVITYLIRVSILSMANQLFGVVSWYWYSDLNLYYLFAELVFVLQITGLIYGGFGRGYTAINFNPSANFKHLHRLQVFEWQGKR